MGKYEQIIPTEPPAPRTPLVLSLLRVVQRELADLKLQIPEHILACAEGKPGAKEALAALREKISAAEFGIENHAATRQLAELLDQQSIVEFKAALQSLPPEEIVAGITRDQCCRRCIPGTACMITSCDPLADRCSHPILVGPLELQRFWANPRIVAIYGAAVAQLGLRSAA